MLSCAHKKGESDAPATSADQETHIESAAPDDQDGGSNVEDADGVGVDLPAEHTDTAHPDGGDWEEPGQQPNDLLSDNDKIAIQER